MKILLICSTSNSIIGFRKKLIEKLIENNHKIVAIAFDSKNKNQIESMGIEFYNVEDNNRSINPLKILTLKNKLFKIIKKVNPTRVVTFMLKPNVFGVLAAKKAKVKKVYSMVEGAGDAFVRTGAKWGLIRTIVCMLYRRAFKYSTKVIFLNTDDRKEFIDKKLVVPQKALLINGIGVDVEHFNFKKPHVSETMEFLMVSRLMKTKGIFEYCEAARKVKEAGYNAVFNLLGGSGTESIDDIKEYIKEGSVNYLGETNNVIPYLEKTNVLVLPSYREGLPMSVMEAESVGRAIIVSDVPGCRDSIIDKYNGEFVKAKDVDSLAQKMEEFINDKGKVLSYSLNSRRLAEERFDQKKINEMLVTIICGE